MRRLIVLLPVLLLTLPADAFAADVNFDVTVTPDTYVPLAPIPGLTETVDPTNTSNIATFFNAIYVFLIGIAVVLAVIMIIWGGFQYALAEAITSKSEGKRKIQQALFGLVLVLSPALVFAIINPAILNLSVNLQPLHTTWGTFFYNAKSYDTCNSVWSDVTNLNFGNIIEHVGGLCVGSDFIACTDTTNCSGAITNCPSGLTYRATCVTKEGTEYAPGTNGAPTNSCNVGDAATCLSLHH